MSNLVARFLPSDNSSSKIPEVSEAKAADFPFLADIPEGEALPEDIVAELDALKADWEEHGGLIIGGAVPGILGVSKQRWAVIKKDYNFRMMVHFGKQWFSRKQLEEYYKRRMAKNGGASTHKAAQALKAAFSEFK